MSDLGYLVFAQLLVSLTFVVVCFRLGLTVFDYFGIRHK